jgi:hypothetical protein
MAEFSVFLVLAASVSWYISASLQSKVHSNEDGYGEGMKYVKNKVAEVMGKVVVLPTYNIKIAPNYAGPLVVIYIQGMGCHPPTAAAVQKFKEFLELDDSDELHVECDDNRLDINKVFRAGKKTKFVGPLADKVAKVLQNGASVLLLGVSYGGALASHVVNALEDTHVDTSKLRVATFGSIYTPLTTHVTHYMIKDDIALKINKLDTPTVGLPFYDNYTGVFWLDHKATVQGRWNPLNNMRWGLHNSYDEVVKAVVSNRGERLDPGNVALY